MKKKSLLAVTLLTLVLASCGSTNEGGNNNDNNNQEKPENNGMSLRMFGDLYMNQARSIFAELEEASDSKILWKSSDEKVVTVSARQGLSSEALLVARGEGKAIVTASLESDPTIQASVEVELKNGEVMPVDLYNKLTGSLKITSDEYHYSYDEKFNKTEDDHFKLVTTYEEYREFEGDEKNTTDGYQLEITNTKNNKVNKQTYVRGDSNKVSTEYIDLYNVLKYETKLFHNGEESVAWLNSPLHNVWAAEEVVTNKDFQTFDGGKTYHFVGFDTASGALAGSMFGLSAGASLDDLYFEVNNDHLKLHSVIEPGNDDVLMKTRFSTEIVSTFSEIGTAQVDHVKPFETKPYHANIKKAVDEVKKNNYTVEYTLDYPGQDDDVKYVYEFTDKDIHYQKYSQGKLNGEGGYHNVGNEKYYSYNVLQDGTLAKDKDSDDTEKFTRLFPQFYFAPEVFKETGVNKFETIDKDFGLFVTHCLRLDGRFSYYTFNENGHLELNENGDLKTVSTVVDAIDEKMNLTATFSKIGSTTVDIDFSKIEDAKLPENWKEANSLLAKDLTKWNLIDVVPYLYSSVGYDDFVYPSKEGVKLKYAFFNTGLFGNNENRDKFINDYKALLLNSGFALTEDVESKTGFNLYKKGGYMIGVGVEKQPTMNDGVMKETTRAQIIILSPNLVEPEF